MRAEQFFSLPIGTLVSGHFKIEAPIMQDQCTELYRALDVAAKKMVSLKILRGSAAVDGSMIMRCQWEAKALTRFAHKSLPRVYDFGIHENAPYLVMDLLEGISLEELVAKEGPLGADQFKTVFTQVANAIDHVHEKNIVHTDLKPEYILIDRDADGSIKVKVIGFIWCRDAEPAAGVIVAEELTGSPYYMSPEQCQGMRPDKRSDVYSLGATMYYALTGSPPFPGETMVDTMSRHISEQPPQITEEKSSPIYVLQQMVVDKCLDKKPENRFQSMKEVEQALVGREAVHKPSASLRGIEKKKKGWWPF